LSRMGMSEPRGAAATGLSGATREGSRRAVTDGLNGATEERGSAAREEVALSPEATGRAERGSAAREAAASQGAPAASGKQSMSVSDSLPAVLAIDGGNSKTEMVLVANDGTLLATVRGPGASQEHHGIDGAMRILGGLVRE